MESSTEKFDRLLKALDELVAEEAALIRAADYAAIGGVQKRAEPVLAALTALAPENASVEARKRVGILLERREQNIETLRTRAVVAREELDSLQGSARRAARIAPVYGQAAGKSGPQRLRAAG
ncbi:hypothetical protein [Opitutus terrae]|uniref:FlgN family protein n=1 Tax=Opitutus terrae (strain DSM 11246 / JCM 15787 / PB90-1) TaxID=452637 RepID=B1ZR66_OPITP|nr:hypothetical protein [Opitutus terrae]ACB73730.1 hypothetical protein Oter_0440 [Opitutus terrae PB90-1]